MNKQQRDTTGALNAWFDPECGQATFAIQVAHGVTPMFLACRATDGCPGTAASLMYPWERTATYSRTREDGTISPQVAERVRWEWYRPDGQAILELPREAREHVGQGGLLLRPITDRGRELLAGRTRP